MARRILILEKPAWMQRAACLGMDPNIFHPVEEKDIPRAKAICEQCSVRVECLDYALRQKLDRCYGDNDGIWGGLTARQRRRIARKRGAA